jgi:hypothetical protein
MNASYPASCLTPEIQLEDLKIDIQSWLKEQLLLSYKHKNKEQSSQFILFPCEMQDTITCVNFY